jgi:phage replication O-like protein O
MLNKINHTQINNDFLDNYMSELSSNATLVFLAISRKTIGWHKDLDKISISQIISYTGLSKNSVIKGIRELEKNQIIIVKREKDELNRNFINEYEINYSSSNEQVVHKMNKGSSQNEQKGSSQNEQTKEIVKETNTKEKEKLFDLWYNKYDKKVSKEKSLQLFIKLSNKEINDCLQCVDNYVKSTPEKQYRKNPDTYLRNKCFNDEIINKQEIVSKYKDLN